MSATPSTDETARPAFVRRALMEPSVIKEGRYSKPFKPYVWRDLRPVGEVRRAHLPISRSADVSGNS